MNPPSISSTLTSWDRRRCGSAIITVLILAAATALIASDFLVRAAQETKLSNRSVYQAVALHLAEAGVEEGLYILNSQNLVNGPGWSLVSGSTTDYQKSITSGFSFGQCTGAIYIRLDNALSATPALTVATSITIPGTPKIVKQLRIGGKLINTVFANALATKGLMSFHNSMTIDAYDSSLGPYNTATNRNDKATLAANSTSSGGTTMVYGYLATTGGTPDLGSGGRVYGATSPGTPLIDPTRVRADFVFNLPDATAPTAAAISLGSVSNITLPRAGDTPGANGRYLYTSTSINISGNRSLIILGPVDIISTGDVSVSGSGNIVVGGAGAVNPSMNIYSPGTIAISGGGLVNATAIPARASIWGTAPSSGSAQTITLSGNATFYGTVYAPNGNANISGSAELFGAMITKTSSFSGAAKLHLDSSLATTVPTGGPTPGATYGTMSVASWVELKDAAGSGQPFARDSRAPFTGLF